MADPDGPILVPIANPETTDRLVETAADLAVDAGETIHFVHVIEVPAQLPLSAGEDLRDEASETTLSYARELSLEVETDVSVRYARSVAGGIASAATDIGPSVLLMGWRGRPPRQTVVLGGHIDRVLRRSPSDMLIQRIRDPRGQVESVLVPVGTGPHTQFATWTAGVLARQCHAEVELLRVETDTSDDELAGRDLLDTARSDLGRVPAVAEEIVSDADPAEAIVARSTEHNVTVLGTSQKHAIQERFLGSVSNAVARDASGTVILAQRRLE